MWDLDRVGTGTLARPCRATLGSPLLTGCTLLSAPTMTTEIRDASLEARIRKQLQATGSSSVEEVLLRLLDTQEEQDRWPLEVRTCMSGKTALGL